MNICIYGAASKTVDAKYIEAVEALGETFAKRGHGLVFGGGASGMMGAAARGFLRGGAKDIICIAPGFFNVDGILFDKCSEYIHPETMRERKKLLEERSDVFVVAPGGIGTLDELFEIITLRSLGRHTKRVVLYNCCGFYDSLVAMLRDYESKGFVKNVDDLFFVSGDASEIVDFVEKGEETGERLEVTRFKNI